MQPIKNIYISPGGGEGKALMAWPLRIFFCSLPKWLAKTLFYINYVYILYGVLF